MRNLALLLCAIFIISCNSIDKKVFEKEKIFLKHQIDSLKQLSENLTKTYSFLFDKALNLEESDKETAISIYKTIADTKNGDFWAVESEKKILNLSKEEVIKRNTQYVSPAEDFYWLVGDTLELVQHNDKCGEWGGDIEIIRIFWKSRKLFGYYIKETYNCDTLVWVGYVNPTIYKSKEIEFSNQLKELLKDTIVSIAEYKLNNGLFFGHSGIVNSVRFKGENKGYELFIRDYSYFSWNTFHKLKNEILLQSQ